MTRLAVFDCDGTLVDGQAAICETMEDAFAAAGLAAPSRQHIRRVVGLSLPQAMAILAPGAGAEGHDRLVGAYKDSFRARRIAGRLDEPLYEGIAELIVRLADDGWQLGIATGKSHRGLTACLAGHGLADRFVTLQTADHHPSKPHPAMLEQALAEAGVGAEAAAMIGDTTFDMAMAGAAGVRAIGVAWGYHEADELLAAGAGSVAETIEELEQEIRR